MAGRVKTPAELEQADLVAVVEALIAEWTGPGPRPPHGVAHLNPDTQRVTFHLHGASEQLPYILAALRAYDPGPPSVEGAGAGRHDGGHPPTEGAQSA